MDTLAASIGDPLVLDPDYSLPSPVHADPLIEVHSITFQPYDESYSYHISGQIYVSDQKDGRINLYDRSQDNPEIMTRIHHRKRGMVSGNCHETGPNGYSLSLTGPTRGAISMVGTPSIVIRLEFHNTYMAAQDMPKNQTSMSRNVQLATQTREVLDTSTHLCFKESKSLTLERYCRGDVHSLGVVHVNYIVMPCASIAYVKIALTKEEEEEEGPDHDPPPDTGSPGVHVSGSIIASYGKTISGNFACASGHQTSFILHKKMFGCDTVAFGVPIKLSSRSFVCIPAYSSLKLILDLTFSFKDFGGGKDDFPVNESTEFRTCDGEYQKKYFSVGKYSLEVMLNFFTSDHPLFLEYIKIRPESPPSAFRNVPSEMSLWGRDRIEVLSVFAGDDSKKIDDVYGIIGVQFCKSSDHIFIRDEKHRGNLSHCGQALSLTGLTTERSDWFCLCLMLKHLGGLVDIHNYLHIYYYHYDLKRQWFNRPLCSVVFGKQGFAVVHYIIFENAVKATLKISVVAKVSDCLPVVYGALVAQYSNYKYPTAFQKNYWRSVLFEEPQEKDARHLIEDGKIPLFKNVVSVPMGSSLCIDVDLHVSVRPSAADHFDDYVEFEIGSPGSKELLGEYCDVLFSTEWTDGS